MVDDKKSTIVASTRGETRKHRTAINRRGIWLRAAVRAKPSAPWLAVRSFSPRIASRLRWWKLPPEVSMARLDRVAVSKEIAQVGSVIGRELSYELIAGLS